MSGVRTTDAEHSQEAQPAEEEVSNMADNQPLIPAERIDRAILLIRGHKSLANVRQEVMKQETAEKLYILYQATYGTQGKERAPSANGGLPLSLDDHLWTIKKGQKYGLSEKQVADALGVSIQYVHAFKEALEQDNQWLVGVVQKPDARTVDC
jgi:hypothetical protein